MREKILSSESDPRIENYADLEITMQIFCGHID